MPNIDELTGKQVMLQIRNSKQVVAAVKNCDQNGIWIEGAGELVTPVILQRTQIKTPMFFVPWTSVDWVVTES